MKADQSEYDCKVHSFRYPTAHLGCAGLSGLLISNYQAEIPDYFVPGEDIVLYSSKEELLDLTAYYLSHPAERKEIAHNAYEKVKAHHTYLTRITQMLETAFHL